MILCQFVLLGMLVAYWEPTPSAMMHIRWAHLTGHFVGKAGKKHCKSMFSPLFGRFFLVRKRTFFGRGVVVWMLHIGRARHPGPGPRDFTPGQLSVEFINVGGWLTSGDLAMDSCAQFLAVAEHRLIPSRARSVGHHLRKTGHQSVWAPACQDRVAGGHAGVGVVSLDGAHLPLPSFVTPQFQEFFRLGRVLRTTLPTAQGGVVHLLVVHGYEGAEEDAENLQLTDRLLQAVLAEAQVVCIGQPMLVAGDLHADPAVIPCLARGISAGRYVDLALAYSLGAGLTPDVTCRFSREVGTGSRREFFVGCPNALAASQSCSVTDRWFTPHLSVLACFRIDAWLADVACPVVCQPIWPACWLDTHDRSSSSSTRVVQDVWDAHRGELGAAPDEAVPAPRGAASRSSVDDFWTIWRRNAEAGLFRLILKLEVLLLLAALPFLAEVCDGFVAGVWEAELLVVKFLGGCIGLAVVMVLMCTVPSTLLIQPFLPSHFFAGVPSPQRMPQNAPGVRVHPVPAGRPSGALARCMSSRSVWSYFLTSSLG